ncbi:IclR family transcriptional regulator [Amycolatopsis echigonensis]|uniref:IclR family transcriptional regulator n=1 Tax=Amycolatopsis echigonensis TaxID=2576905 RepID=A0A8E2B760_9PSEU|nr:IclR family transcriptional regulator [Amycolatopsis echigonensis]MBB2504404.1 IclR family transcriptional regulator [Amycolatopsis echigonensis]
MSELKTLRNGLALLRLLEGRDATAITDLAKELQISPSTAHRIASTLRTEGFLRQDPHTRRYLLGPGIVLGRPGAELERCLEVAPDHLASLRDSTGETVHIAVRTGRQVRFPLAVESTRQVRVASSVGRTVPVHATAAGKILLAQLPDTEIRKMLGSELEALTPHTLRTTDALLRELADVRRNGYAINASETDLGLYTVAVTVEGRDGKPLCALAVSAPLARVRRDPAKREPAVEDRLLDALRLCSSELAAHLRQ